MFSLYVDDKVVIEFMKSMYNEMISTSSIYQEQTFLRILHVRS